MVTPGKVDLTQPEQTINRASSKIDKNQLLE
jgi:hypothetical protein